jgi:hypothetical protein
MPIIFADTMRPRVDLSVAHILLRASKVRRSYQRRAPSARPRLYQGRRSEAQMSVCAG